MAAGAARATILTFRNNTLRLALTLSNPIVTKAHGNRRDDLLVVSQVRPVWRVIGFDDRKSVTLFFGKRVSLIVRRYNLLFLGDPDLYIRNGRLIRCQTSNLRILHDLFQPSSYCVSRGDLPGLPGEAATDMIKVVDAEGLEPTTR